MKRKWLANPKDGRVIPYAVDEHMGVMPCYNLDFGYMFTNREWIRTGFKTEKEAKKWLSTLNPKNRKQS